MIYTWLTQKRSDQLLIFYNGWGMDERVVSHLESRDYDICTCHDFRIIPPSNPEIWSNYKHITVVGWSLGVLAAHIHLSKIDLPVARSIAINGTITPINDSCGIPEEIYWGTLHGLNETTRDKFFRRMCGDKRSFDRFKQIQPHRRLDEQKEELVAFANHSQNSPEIHQSWSSVIAGKKDRIFPYANQRKFWDHYPQLSIRNPELPHFPFFNWNSWNDLVNYSLNSIKAAL